MDTAVPPPPPPLAAPPAPVERALPGPDWPWWYGPVALVAGVIAGGVLGAIVITIAGISIESPAATVVGTLIADAFVVGAAVLFASLVAFPRIRDFGLRPTAFWPAVGWTALAILVFFVFSAVYEALLNPDVEQTVSEDLGADRGIFGLVVAGVVVTCVAPVAEEIFFRGFLYRAIRSRMPMIAAALAAGLLFGAVHWDFSTSKMLLVVPPLALLGTLLCLLYERTGSLYPPIAWHVLNNCLAYAVATSSEDGWRVVVVTGPLMLAACVVAPWAQRRWQSEQPAGA